MKRLILSILFLLLPLALQGQHAGIASGYATLGGSPNNTAVFRGCLQQENGNYTLRNEVTGDRHLLSGNRALLSHHIGLSVELSGQLTSLGANQPGSMAGLPSNDDPTLNVKSLLNVNGYCQKDSRPDMQPRH